MGLDAAEPQATPPVEHDDGVPGGGTLSRGRRLRRSTSPGRRPCRGPKRPDLLRFRSDGRCFGGCAGRNFGLACKSRISFAADRVCVPHGFVNTACPSSAGGGATRRSAVGCSNPVGCGKLDPQRERILCTPRRRARLGQSCVIQYRDRETAKGGLERAALRVFNGSKRG